MFCNVTVGNVCVQNESRLSRLLSLLRFFRSRPVLTQICGGNVTAVFYITRDETTDLVSIYDKLNLQKNAHESVVSCQMYSSAESKLHLDCGWGDCLSSSHSFQYRGTVRSHFPAQQSAISMRFDCAHTNQLIVEASQ